MKTRCEGWRRYGGAFSLGPVSWEQCKDNATVTAVFTNLGDKKGKRMPACDHCLREAQTTTGMKVTGIKKL